MKKLLILASMASIIFSGQAMASDLVGEYVGKIDAKFGYFKDNPTIAFQVYKENNKYKVGIYPDLWRRAAPYAKLESKGEGSKITFATNGWFALKGEITKDGLKGVATSHNKEGKCDSPFEIKKLDRKSPTLGKKAPEGADVLFDGKSFEQWKFHSGKPVSWKLMPDGSMEVARTPTSRGSLVSKKAYKDLEMHIEFMIPDESDKTLGQGRGNSGVFIGNFEVQVLDSFGMNGLWNECGALYKYMPPQVNASMPPLKWQTYDIKYRAPRFKDGKISEYPRITVVHNGIIIHNDVELREATSNSSAYRSIENMKDIPVHISMQDHGNPIRFRNIWVKSL